MVNGMIKGAKTIAEYAIRSYLENKFQMEKFRLQVDGNNAVLVDMNGDTLRLRYDSERRSVSIVE